jgi:mannose-6-phosphate isomerase
MKSIFYPLTFRPIIKERIWGGTKLKSLLHKPITSEFSGESWEISTVDKDVSIVDSGIYEGKDLNELITLFPQEILGKKVLEHCGTQFPLLFKYLDAREDLSIQLHPNDELAKKRHNALGKTEMWYVMQADEGARIIVGFKENASPEAYLHHLEGKTLPSILQEIPVKKGDAFLLESGTIHAIGAGIVIAEIQQTSDITYRIYDWDRVDALGNSRELHIDLALEAINYTSKSAQHFYLNHENSSNTMIHCPYFKTNAIPLNGKMSVTKNDDSFLVYMCTEGNFDIWINHQRYSYSMGDTVLLPAVINNFDLEGMATLLEISA